MPLVSFDPTAVGIFLIFFFLLVETLFLDFYSSFRFVLCSFLVDYGKDPNDCI